MPISRRLPISNIGRLGALDAAKRKSDSSNITDSILSSNTINRLNNFYPIYKNAYENRMAALGAQTSATEVTVQDRNNARTFTSHFIQVFNLGIDREKYIAEHRSFYGVGLNVGALPGLSTEADILIWCNRLITGDAERLAAGGLPMDNPSIAEVDTAYRKLLLSIDNQSNKKDAYDKAQEALEALNPEADKLILRIWNEIDTAYDDHEPSSRRRKGREWGIIFTSTTSATAITGIVLHASDGLPIAQAKVQLLEADISTKTDAKGAFSINTDLIGKVTLLVQKIDFQHQTISIELEENKPMVVKIQLTKI